MVEKYISERVSDGEPIEGESAWAPAANGLLGSLTENAARGPPAFTPIAMPSEAAIV
jgi:hypothetical protein